MRFNFNICHHMQVGYHNISTKYTLHEENEILERHKSEKDLGVIIDITISFWERINNYLKVNLANGNLGIIFRAFTYLDEETFSPSLQVAGQTPPRLLKANLVVILQKGQIMIENVQRRATKLVSEFKNLNYSERL